jgi:hypothetical protein
MRTLQLSPETLTQIYWFNHKNISDQHENNISEQQLTFGPTTVGMRRIGASSGSIY